MRPPRPSRIDRATELAFAGRLRAARTALGDVAIDDLCSRWVRAYLDAACGRFSRAERNARVVLGRAGDRGLHASSAITLGSILRQTGRHAEAAAIESAALRTAPTEALRAHLLIGLAADAVGRGDLSSVDRTLDRVPSGNHGWRVAIRLRWVRCERELLAGRPARAARWARAAVELSEREGARRHLAKSLLFLGASRLEAARRAPDRAAVAEATESLRRARSIARRIGARPIERIAGKMLPGAAR